MGRMRRDDSPPTEIRDFLSYERDTGVFRWIRSPQNRIKVGLEAGSPNQTGYVLIKFRGRFYVRSRLAWWFVHGEMPPSDLDHRNGNRVDDRIDNLRPATGYQNARNGKGYGRCPYRGVRQHSCGRWEARITVEHQQINIGLFDTADAAAKAYDRMAVKHFGEFARLNFPVSASTPSD